MPASALGTYGVDLALELLEQIRLTCDPDAHGRPSKPVRREVSNSQVWSGDRRRATKGGQSAQKRRATSAMTASRADIGAELST
jgi:hypothetical protein